MGSAGFGKLQHLDGLFKKDGWDLEGFGAGLEIAGSGSGGGMDAFSDDRLQLQTHYPVKQRDALRADG